MRILDRRFQCNEVGGERIATEIVRVAVGRFRAPQTSSKSDMGAQVYWSQQPWIHWLLEHKLGEITVDTYQEANTWQLNSAIIVEMRAEDATYMAMKWDV